MDTVSYSDLRQKLKSYLDKVYADHNPIIITRKNNENLVLLSMAEYSSLLETSHLMAHEANAKHLLKSIQQARPGRAHAEKLSALETEDYIGQRAKRGSRAKYIQILREVPNRKPDRRDLIQRGSGQINQFRTANVKEP